MQNIICHFYTISTWWSLLNQDFKFREILKYTQMLLWEKIKKSFTHTELFFEVYLWEFLWHLKMLKFFGIELEKNSQMVPLRVS